MSVKPLLKKAKRSKTLRGAFNIAANIGLVLGGAAASVAGMFGGAAIAVANPTLLGMTAGVAAGAAGVSTATAAAITCIKRMDRTIRINRAPSSFLGPD